MYYIATPWVSCAVCRPTTKTAKLWKKKKNEDNRYIAVVIWSWFTNGNVHDAVYMVVLNAYYVTSDEYFSRRSDLVLVGILAFPFFKGQ